MVVESDSTANLVSSRTKTDKSLEDERLKTDSVIDLKSTRIEEASDKKTRLNRTAADMSLETVRAVVDKKQRNINVGTENVDLIRERERSDEAQMTARREEDRVRDRERFQKRLIAEAVLVSERKDTDSNLLDEREQTDVEQDFSKNALITRDQFLAVVSHDLKSPLTSISLGVGLMRIALSGKTSNEKSLQDSLVMIERSVASMDRMITDLLDVERISNDKLFLQLENQNIGELLIECSKLFEPVANSKSISLSVESLSAPVFAEIDHDRILQVLSNLIGNAMKFSPKGSAITLSACHTGQEVEIAVNDNGPGISDAKKTEIFERFSQLNVNDRNGLGLGLFISKWIVEAHKGHIMVNSVVGKGSTFIFKLPANASPKLANF